MGTAIDLKPFLRWIPDRALDFDLKELADAEVAVADSIHPDCAVNKYPEGLREASQFRGFIPSISRHALETVWRRVTNGEGRRDAGGERPQLGRRIGVRSHV